jgi:ABC-2 type transport system ATP-binding protein
MESLIQVDNLVKKYAKSNRSAVDNISFDVKEGEFFAFLGPNGAGKTTTISILTTTLNKTSGSVKIAGYDLDTQEKQVRENIGIIFQKPSLDLDLSAEENIRIHVSMFGIYPYRPFFKMMPAAYRKQITELAEIVGLKENIFKRLKTFSGGMQRKFEIIRSLMHSPKILFLDEPTQGLDPVSRRSLWEYLNRARLENGTTIFLTTHYLDEAEEVDRVCIIDQGKISLLGTPSEMKNKLIDRFMVIDAMDRLALERELHGHPISVTLDGQFRVNFTNETPQEIIAGLKTPLSKLKIHEPSLEDAYVNLLGKNAADNESEVDLVNRKVGA